MRSERRRRGWVRAAVRGAFGRLRGVLLVFAVYSVAGAIAFAGSLAMWTRPPSRAMGGSAREEPQPYC